MGNSTIITKIIPKTMGVWSMFFIITQLIVRPYLEPNIYIKILEIKLCIYGIIFLTKDLMEDIWSVAMGR